MARSQIPTPAQVHTSKFLASRATVDVVINRIVAKMHLNGDSGRVSVPAHDDETTMAVIASVKEAFGAKGWRVEFIDDQREGASFVVSAR